VQLEGLLTGDEKELEKTITKIVDEKSVQEPNLPMCYGLPGTKLSSGFFSHGSRVRPLCMPLAACPQYKHGVP
jgi:hypothetical protein